MSFAHDSSELQRVADMDSDERSFEKTVSPNVKEHGRYLAQTYSSHIERNTSDEERAALRRYTDTSYRDLNDVLIKSRDGKISGWHPDKDVHEHLQNVFEKAGKPADHDIHVYAGMSRTKLNQNRGRFKAYTSTSIDPRVAFGFAEDAAIQDDHDERHVAHFVIKKGQKGWLYMGNHSKFSHEREVLLKHNTKVRHVTTSTYTGRRGAKFHVHTFHILD